jgi:Protein of unknown function (DUF2510)
MVEPGFYDDPIGARRWWDGRQWTDSTLTDEGTALRRGFLPPAWSEVPVAVVTGLAWAVAFAVIVDTRLTHRPIAPAGLLLVPAIPIFIIALISGGAVLTRRLASEWDLPFRRFPERRQPAVGGSRRALRWALDYGPGLLFIALIVTGVVVGTADKSGSSPSPERATTACPYPVTNDGAVSCLTPAQYERADAGNQTFAAGVLSLFFGVGCCAVLAARSARRTPPEGPAAH